MSACDEPFYLTTVDPGGTTGMALWHITPDVYTVCETAAIAWKPLYGLSPIPTLSEWGKRYADLPHLLLYEGFRMRPGVHPDLSSPEVIGAIKHWLAYCEQRPPHRPGRYTRFGQTLHSSPYCLLIEKEPVEAKHLATDQILDRLGLLISGMDRNHIHDAHRHAVSWLADPGRAYLPVCRLAWPQHRRR